AGRCDGVSGPSGSGKSTLLDLLALVMRPSAAERFRIAQAGNGAAWDIDKLWQRNEEETLTTIRRTTFGYVLQSGGLIAFLTVRQNLMIPYQLAGRRPDQGRIEQMAKRFGIERELDKKPRHLSMGQRQRVAILRALMLEPALVLADEPTAAIDQVRAKQVAAEFRSLARETGSTIVMASQDVEVLKGVAEHTLELATTVDAHGVAVSKARWAGVKRAARVHS